MAFLDIRYKVGYKVLTIKRRHTACWQDDGNIAHSNSYTSLTCNMFWRGVARDDANHPIRVHAPTYVAAVFCELHIWEHAPYDARMHHLYEACHSARSIDIEFEFPQYSICGKMV